MKKNVTYVTLWGAYMFSKVQICDAKIVYVDDLANWKSNLMVCTFQKSFQLLKLSKMLIVNICNWLLQVNGAITRVLAYCKILAR